MSKGWIAIFKPGTHTDAAGNKRNWTEEDVQSMADVYNNQLEKERHDAPIVKGHPKTDDPAYGWIDKLKYEAGKLWAKPKQVAKAFANEVKEGKFKKISVALYPDGLLRHVGFLGAVPPAVKGLGDAELAELAAFNDDETDSKDFLDDIDVDSIELADTVDKLREAQESRSKKYGIAIKSARGVVTKPEHYSNLKDDDFGDPVHYRFPIHDKSNTIVSLSSFNRYDFRNDYTEEEKQLIGSRLVKAAEDYGIDGKDTEIYRYMFEDKMDDNKNKSNFNHKEEMITVDEKTKAFKDSFISKLKDETNEDIATRADKIFMDVYSASNPAPDPKKKEVDDSGGTTQKADAEDKQDRNFEESEAFKKLEKENREIRDKLRRKEFEEFLESDEMKCRITRAQKEGALQMLEMAYNANLEFTDGEGKKFTSVDQVKKHLMSLTPVVELGKVIPPEQTSPEHEFNEQDKFLEEYNKEKGV
jgi:hypothetical protein